MKALIFALLFLSACSSDPETTGLPDARSFGVKDEGRSCTTPEGCLELCLPSGACASYWGHKYLIKVPAAFLANPDAFQDSDGSAPDIECTWTDEASGRTIGHIEFVENSFEPEFDSGEILELHPGVHPKFRCYDLDPRYEEPSREVGTFCWEEDGSCSSIPTEVLRAGEVTVPLLGGEFGEADLTISIEVWD